ncbi:MAG: hypothetical protein RL718_270, partial [Actinomycetota bacterium]
MISRRLSISVVVSLVLSLFGTLPSMAYDPGLITKTVH